MEEELEPAAARVLAAHQRLVGAPVRIGRNLKDQLPL
jgi:hypothetical protein